MEIIEGPITLNLCLTAPEVCTRDTWCAAHLVWEQAQAALKTVLDQATIARLAEDSARRLQALKQQRKDINVEIVESCGPVALAVPESVA